MELSEVIVRLIADGMSEAAIAEEVGVSQPTIHRIKHGAGTSFENGNRIQALARKRGIVENAA